MYESMKKPSNVGAVSPATKKQVMQMVKGAPNFCAAVFYDNDGTIIVFNYYSLNSAGEGAASAIINYHKLFNKVQVFNKKGEFVYEIRASEKTGEGYKWYPSQDAPILVSAI